MRQTRREHEEAQVKNSRPKIGEIVLVAGAAAFLMTSTLLAAVKTVRKRQEMKRYLSGETTDGLAGAAESILQLIEDYSQSPDGGEQYPASFLLKLEQEQHRMVEAYGRLYHLLGAKERRELPQPEQLLIFRGIAAYEALPIHSTVSASAERRRNGESDAVGKPDEGSAHGFFVPDAYQLESLNLLYLLCLDIHSVVREERRWDSSADRSERSAARLLTTIGQRLG
ncbi:hypothetical protein B9G55_18125 [Saccharibacillus sp. O16]|nr:hypothetical protein B9G55_18125 [Saccharibacillus sp. O16]